MLSWDSKWIYVVSHFVKAGAVRPETFVDQPWRSGGGSKRKSSGGRRAGAPGNEDEKQSGPVAAPQAPHPAIYCTCITKYVMKKGCKTVPPEEFLRACDLLPDVPEGSEGPEAELLADILKRRSEGLALAEHFAALDQGHDWFTEDTTVFGSY